MRTVLQTKKALGLVEVLIVLAIVGVTMVAAMQLTTGAFRSIRDNEITDLASGIILQGMEIAKSPQGVSLTSPGGTIFDPEGSYSLDTTQNPPMMIQQNSGSDQLINTCNSTSPFFC